MPITRATIAARHHGAPVPGSKQVSDANDEITAIKAANAAAPNKVSTTLGKRDRPFARTNSMPVLSCSSATERNGHNSSAASTSRGARASDRHRARSSSSAASSSSSSSSVARSSDGRLIVQTRSRRAFSSARSSCSTSSSLSSRKPTPIDRADDGSDDSDDEERNIRLRLGGCHPNVEALSMRDDSNKENIAPLRSLSEHTLHRESTTQQEDHVARRTRTRASRPMSDRSDAPSVSSPTLQRVFQRTVSTPVRSGKRLRAADSILADDGGLPSPTARLRIDSGSDDAESCYFSSQGTSLFDRSSSQGSPLDSRCTTPDLAARFDDEDEEDSKSDAETTMAIDDSDACQTSCLGDERQYANVFVHARALLRYGAGSEKQVIGRERERGTLHRFLQRRMGVFQHMEHSATPDGETLGVGQLDGASDSGSLYICGMPGTGKTALVKSVLEDVQQQLIPQAQSNAAARVAFIDCMTVQHPRELFRCVLEALHEDVSSLPSGEQCHQEAERRVTSIVTDPERRTLIVLDEIDHLMRSRVHQNILYHLFSWPMHSETCSLIGIANSLDLTERFVPLLASKGAAPAVLNFRPFEAQEIMCILRARLALLQSRYGKGASQEGQEGIEEAPDAATQHDAVPLFVPAAFELLARKISTATGDLRKALDGARLAVDAIESDLTRNAGRTTAADTASSCDLSKYTPSDAPKATPGHVLRVLSAVLGSPQLTKLRALGLQAKLVLLAYLVAHKRAGYNLPVLGGATVTRSTSTGSKKAGNSKAYMAGAVSLSDVECTYTAMLKNDDFARLETSELMGVMEGLEVEGVVRFVATSSSPGRPPAAATNGAGLSMTGALGMVSGGKRGGAQAQRCMVLAMSHDDVARGITTAAGRASSASASATTCSPIVAAAIQRIWAREEHNAERAKGWEAQAALSDRVRTEELGGGRGAVGI